MVASALITDGVFSALGLIPAGARPTRADVFGSVAVNYKLFLNIAGLAVFAALVGLTARRGATDPVCGMKVDRSKAIKRSAQGRAVYFCSQGCCERFFSESPDSATTPAHSQ
jgi:YHS domain-containing protein